MSDVRDFDWNSATCEEQVRQVRSVSQIERDRVMREYDWSQHPEAVLGWLSAQKGIGLSSALSAFFNGDPWRFNYLPKRDVSAEFCGEASLLDSICRRINAGFYLPDMAPLCPQNMGRLEAWVANQRQDIREHRRGRWVIEDEALEPMFACKRAEMEEALRLELASQAEAATAASPVLKKLSLKRLAGSLAR